MQQMPQGREQSQLMSPQATYSARQPAITLHTGKNTNKSTFKDKLHQMCMEELSHHVQDHGPSAFSLFSLHCEE